MGEFDPPHLISQGFEDKYKVFSISGSKIFVIPTQGMVAAPIEAKLSELELVK